MEKNGWDRALRYTIASRHTWIGRYFFLYFEKKFCDPFVVGFVAENGDLELRNVNARDTGNYTCVMTYMSPENEEPVENVYGVNLQGANR